MELLRVGPGAPVPRECYIQYGSVTGLGLILLVPCHVGFSSLLRVPKTSASSLLY